MEEEYKRYKKFEKNWTRRGIWMSVLIGMVLLLTINYVEFRTDSYAQYVNIVGASQRYEDNTALWKFHLEVTLSKDFNETLTYIKVKDNWNKSTVQIAGFYTNITLRPHDTLKIDVYYPMMVLDGDIVELTLSFETFSTRINVMPFPVVSSEFITGCCRWLVI